MVEEARNNPSPSLVVLAEMGVDNPEGMCDDPPSPPETAGLTR